MEARVPKAVTTARAALEKRIFSGSIPPGARVREARVALEIGTSRGPVREACRQLEGDRIVTAIPNKGTYVRWVESDEAQNLFEIREELSGLIARGIACRDYATVAGDLFAIIDRIDSSIERSDTESFFPLNLAFHECLLGATGNARLEDIFMGIFRELRLFRLQSYIAEETAPRFTLLYNRASNEGHRKIVEAIATGDATEIESVLRMQVRHSRDRSAHAFASHHAEADGTIYRRSAS